MHEDLVHWYATEDKSSFRFRLPPCRKCAAYGVVYVICDDREGIKTEELVTLMSHPAPVKRDFQFRGVKTF